MSDSFTGIECSECKGYFRIQRRSGGTGRSPRCHCPYCGHKPSPIRSWPRGLINRTSTPLTEHPPEESDILDAAVQEFETEIVCDKCGFEFAVYGVFKACPGCGPQNSLQFLKANPDVIRKEISLARTLEPVDAAPLIEKASRDARAAQDAFWQGRRSSDGFDPHRYPALAKRQKEIEENPNHPAFAARAAQLERKRQELGLPPAFSEFPTPELALEWSLVEREREVREHLSLIEHMAEEWIDNYGEDFVLDY